MKNKYDILLLKFNLLISEGCNLKKSWGCLLFFGGLLFLMVLCLVGFFFYKTKNVIEEANLHTRAATESFPVQSDGPSGSAWHPLPPEQSSSPAAVTSGPGQAQLFG